MPAPEVGNGTRHTLVQCDYFTLELLSAETKSIELDTKGETFHAITIIEGKASLRSGDEQVELDRFQTAVIPAQVGECQFQPLADCQALKSSVS